MAVVLALTHLRSSGSLQPNLASSGVLQEAKPAEARRLGQNPLGWLLLSLQLESPHVGGSPLLGLVHRTGVDTLGSPASAGMALMNITGRGGVSSFQFPLAMIPA